MDTDLESGARKLECHADWILLRKILEAKQEAFKTKKNMKHHLASYLKLLA